MKKDELEAVVRALRDRDVRGTDYLFASERGARLTRNGFWRVLSERASAPGYRRNVCTHQLRRGCGYYLANRGWDLRLIQDYHGQVHDPQCRRGLRGFGKGQPVCDG